MQKYSIQASCCPLFIKWGQEAVRSGYFNMKPLRTFQSCMSKLMKNSIAYYAKLFHKDIRISDLSIARVSYFLFIQNIQHLLQDEYLMEDDSNYAYNGNSNSFADPNTSTCWKNAEKHMNTILDLHDIRDRANIYLCPIVLFIDGSHCDRNGRLQAEHVLCLIGHINMEKRTKPRACIFGIITK